MKKILNKIRNFIFHNNGYAVQKVMYFHEGGYYIGYLIYWEFVFLGVRGNDLMFTAHDEPAYLEILNLLNVVHNDVTHYKLKVL